MASFWAFDQFAWPAPNARNPERADIPTAPVARIATMIANEDGDEEGDETRRWLRRLRRGSARCAVRTLGARVAGHARL